MKGFAIETCFVPLQVFRRHWAHIQNRLPENTKYKTRQFTVNATKETPSIDDLIDMMPFVR
jgi:hypothetical protein